MNASSEDLIPLDPREAFYFDCNSNLDCFNYCCHDMVQILYPYDILRLKNHLQLKSYDFLKKYCLKSEGENSGLPTVSLKTEEKDDWACPFVTGKGCSVYENRPASCRMFPLARALVKDRRTGEVRELYAKIPDSACLGFSSDQAQDLNSWLKKQEIKKYNSFNDLMMPIISLKRRIMPGPLEKREKEIFIKGCYDIDGFKEDIFEKGKLEDIFEESRLESAKEEESQLMALALDWVRFSLFGRAV